MVMFGTTDGPDRVGLCLAPWAASGSVAPDLGSARLSRPRSAWFGLDDRMVVARDELDASLHQKWNVMLTMLSVSGKS